MKNLQNLILILSALFCTIHCDESLDEEWELFKLNHGKKYSNEPKRKLIWEQNREKIKAISKFNKSFKIIMNKFADLTNEEFKKLMNGFKPNRTKFIRNFYQDDDESNFMTRRFDEYDLRNLPQSVDWRTRG